jgi:hypothetical protein
MRGGALGELMLIIQMEGINIYHYTILLLLCISYLNITISLHLALFLRAHI